MPTLPNIKLCDIELSWFIEFEKLTILENEAEPSTFNL